MSSSSLGGGGSSGNRRCRGRTQIDCFAALAFFALVFCSSLQVASTYYLPGTYPREFKRGEHVQGKVKKRTRQQGEKAKKKKKKRRIIKCPSVFFLDNSPLSLSLSLSLHPPNPPKQSRSTPSPRSRRSSPSTTIPCPFADLQRASAAPRGPPTRARSSPASGRRTRPTT